MDSPKIVIVGHCCLDKKDEAQILGGSASYINAILNSRGIKPTLITAFGRDFKFANKLQHKGSNLIVQASENTTIFHNIYKDQDRTQYLLSKADNIRWHDKYKALEPIDILFLSPIADEVDYNFIQEFNANLKVATLQGWLRKQSANKSISPKWIDPQVLSGLDIAIFSVEDYPGFEKHIDELVEVIPIVVVTNGRHGAELYTKENHVHYPSIKINEIDPTGAGDSFACGMALAFSSIQNLSESIIHAHSLASVVIEHEGVYFPTEVEISNKLKVYPRDLIKILPIK
jgi:sugar/nucleoside kinase (ribokinase family)